MPIVAGALGDNRERISRQDSKDCFIRNSTTPSTGSRAKVAGCDFHRELVTS